MKRVELDRIAVGAPALQAVFLITRPEGELVRAWSRAPSGALKEHASTFNELFADAALALGSFGTGTETTGLMVESEDRLLVMESLSIGVVAGFVFDRSAPIGLVRLQVRQLSVRIRRDLLQSVIEDRAQDSE